MQVRLGALVLLAVLLGAFPATADLPKEAYFELDGVGYEYVSGVLGTEHMTLGLQPNTTERQSWIGSAFAMVHPGTPNGRVIVHGLYNNLIPVNFYIEDFRLADGTRGYSYDHTVEADTKDGVGYLVADLALEGNITMRVNGQRYYDPVSSQSDPTILEPPQFLEADKEQPKLTGALYIARQGTRDDLTGELLPAPASDQDGELHLRIQSRPEAEPYAKRYVFSSPGSSPPTDSYSAYHQFWNLKFGGMAHVEIETESFVLPGMNSFKFTALNPHGGEIANFTLTPAILAPDTVTFDFPLDEFGTYMMVVQGNVTTGSYTVSVTEEPPAGLDLRVWWDNVTYGSDAYEEYKLAKELTSGPNKPRPVVRVIDRPDPPQVALPWVITGVVAGATVLVLVVKLVSDQLSLSAFRKNR